MLFANLLQFNQIKLLICGLDIWNSTDST